MFGYTLAVTTGQASPDDLKRFADAMSPKTLVPIHTAFPEEIDRAYPHVVRHEDAEWWKV